MNPLDSAALDAHIAGGHYTKSHVIARCKNGHTWCTIAETEYGKTEYKHPDCPAEGCGEPVEDTEPNEGD